MYRRGPTGTVRARYTARRTPVVLMAPTQLRVASGRTVRMVRHVDPDFRWISTRTADPTPPGMSDRE